jgi:hypothetical protein
VTRQEFLDYARGFVDIYQKLWRRHLWFPDWRRKRWPGKHPNGGHWILFEIESYSPEAIPATTYLADLIAYKYQSGFRTQIIEYPPRPGPVAGIEQEGDVGEVFETQDFVPFNGHLMPESADVLSEDEQEE